MVNIHINSLISGSWKALRVYSQVLILVLHKLRSFPVAFVKHVWECVKVKALTNHSRVYSVVQPIRLFKTHMASMCRFLTPLCLTGSWEVPCRITGAKISHICRRIGFSVWVCVYESSPLIISLNSFSKTSWVTSAPGAPGGPWGPGGPGGPWGPGWNITYS